VRAVRAVVVSPLPRNVSPTPIAMMEMPAMEPNFAIIPETAFLELLPIPMGMEPPTVSMVVPMIPIKLPREFVVAESLTRIPIVMGPLIATTVAPMSMITGACHHNANDKFY
jgi:hypothetical protein